MISFLATDWPGPCKNNWTQVNDLCYLISDYNDTLPEAQYFCALNEGILFEPRSEPEDLNLRVHLNTMRRYWIGIGILAGQK